MNKQTSTEAITLGPADDLTQQIESGKPFEEITLLLPGGTVRRPLTEFEVELLRLNIPRDADS